MNGHDPFEQRLRRQPLRPVPPAWREAILAEAQAAKPRPENQTAWVAGWRLLFARLPLAWGSLAAVWVALIGVNLMLPGPIVSVAEQTPTSVRLADLAALDFPAAEYDSTSAPQTPPPAASPTPKPADAPLRPRSQRRGGMHLGESPASSLFEYLV